MSWDLVEMWHSMSIIPKAVVFTLVLMSVYCFATGIERENGEGAHARGFAVTKQIFA